MLNNIVRGDAALNIRVFESKIFDSSKKEKTTFIVGQLVQVSRRTEVGMCEPGGIARITAASKDRSGLEHYDVSYVVDGRKEIKVLRSILTEHTDFEGRPRRSLEASTTGQNIDADFFVTVLVTRF